MSLPEPPPLPQTLPHHRVLDRQEGAFHIALPLAGQQLIGRLLDEEPRQHASEILAEVVAEAVPEEEGGGALLQDGESRPLPVAAEVDHGLVAICEGARGGLLDC